MGIGYDFVKVKYEGLLCQIAKPGKQPTQDLGWTTVYPPEVHRHAPVARATDKPSAICRPNWNLTTTSLGYGKYFVWGRPRLW